MSKPLTVRIRNMWTRRKNGGTGTTTAPSRRGRPVVEGLEERALLASVAEFPIPSNSGSAHQIVAGPDGALWFTENDPVSNAIGRITTSGQVTEYKIPTFGADPFGITVGPDNNIWFTEEFGDKIGRITPSGQITEFALGKGTSFPEGITTGPDGNLWFCSNLSGAIGKMTTSGQVTLYPLPTLSSPINITTGPDGNLWFTDTGKDTVNKITTSGQITSYKLPSIIADPHGIVSDPQKMGVWVTEDFLGKLAFVSTSGSVSEYTVPGNFPQPNGITVGPDGNLWLALQGGKEIAQFNISALQFTTYSIPGSNPQPTGITKGPDSNLWFTDKGNKSIGEVVVGTSVGTPTPTTPTTTTTPTPTTPTTTPTPTTPTTTPTPTATSTIGNFSGKLDPASDSGPSSSDGATDINRPTFIGTGTSGATVTLFAQAVNSASVVQIGQGTVTSAGTWSITASQPLADGAYIITATTTVAGQSNVSTIQILPNASEGNLVIDTVGPTITNAAINAGTGQITLSFLETGSGLVARELASPATYIVTGPGGRRDTFVAVATVPGGSSGITEAVLTLNHGHALRRGQYTVRIRAASLTDIAGNGLNGSFYFGFPTGASTTSSDFVMAFQTDGTSASAPHLPASVVGGDLSYVRYVKKHMRFLRG